MYGTLQNTSPEEIRFSMGEISHVIGLRTKCQAMILKCSKRNFNLNLPLKTYIENIYKDYAAPVFFLLEQPFFIIAFITTAIHFLCFYIPKCSKHICHYIAKYHACMGICIILHLSPSLPVNNIQWHNIAGPPSACSTIEQHNGECIVFTREDKVSCLRGCWLVLFYCSR